MVVSSWSSVVDQEAGAPPFAGSGKGGDFYYSPLEDKRQGIGFPRDNDQVNVIRHETIPYQGKMDAVGHGAAAGRGKPSARYRWRG